MGEKQGRKKVLKILSRIDASVFDIQDLAIQVRASSLGELLEDAAKTDEAIIYADNDELVRLLWERIGNADVAETPPQIGEEVFYLVGLRGRGEGPAKVENVVVYRCVTARGVWL
jgi:signal recognition particle GTPase